MLSEPSAPSYLAPAGTGANTRAMCNAHVSTPVVPTGAPLLVVDVETTGLDPTDALTEIAALWVTGGQVRRTFHTLVNPGKPIPEIVTRITGIDQAMVSGAPTQSEAIGSFLTWLTVDFGGAVDSPRPLLVAHNVPFDRGFLSRAALGAGMVWPELDSIDTLALSRALLPRPAVPNHRLGTLAAHLCHAQGQQHRALADAHMTWRVLEALLDMAAAKA